MRACFDFLDAAVATAPGTVTAPGAAVSTAAVTSARGVVVTSARGVVVPINRVVSGTAVTAAQRDASSAVERR